MSAKQSKIYSFFQRKPSLSANSSPSITKTDAFNKTEGDGAVASPNASGDTSHGSKPNGFSSTLSIDSATKKRKLANFEREKAETNPNLSYVEEQLAVKREKKTNSADEDEQLESRPPKLKRKRIVSILNLLEKP